MVHALAKDDYNAENDPHSLRFKGKRHIAPSEGAVWGNIRHGKGLRHEAHEDLLIKYLKEDIDILDDGANRRTFLKFLEKNYKKFNYFGCEPDTICNESHTNLKNKVQNSYLEDFKIKNKVDFVYTSHTFEHVDDINKHLICIDQKIKKNGILFIDLPNTQQIDYEEFALEEYFVEKHKFNFWPDDILSILEFMSFEIIEFRADPFNFTVVAKKTHDLNIDFSKFSRPPFIVESKIRKIKEYFAKRKTFENTLNKIGLKINDFKKNKDIIFYGGGRLLKSFLSESLDLENVKYIVDNHLFDKTKHINNLNLSTDESIKEMPKKTPIILFTRSSSLIIKKKLVEEYNFQNIYNCLEFHK